MVRHLRMFFTSVWNLYFPETSKIIKFFHRVCMCIKCVISKHSWMFLLMVRQSFYQYVRYAVMRKKYMFDFLIKKYSR